MKFYRNIIKVGGKQPPNSPSPPLAVMVAPGVQRIIRLAIKERASRENLWGMPLREIDLEAMVTEIVEALGYYESKE